MSPLRGEPGPVHGGIKGTVQECGFGPVGSGEPLSVLESENDLMKLASENINLAVISGMYGE